MSLRAASPEQHLSDESKDTVNIGIRLIATMTALVLGLVTASAKSSFDALDTAVKHSAGDVITLDRILADYGPESREAREALYQSVEHRLGMTWPKDPSRAAELEMPDVEGVVGRIRRLSPQNDDQRWLQSRALDLGEALLDARWVVLSSVGASVSVPFLAALLFWLTVIFASFGLFAPRNATVIAVLFVCALSVASAVFLILEMDGPFEGLVKISPDPLRYALSQMEK